MEKLTPWQRHVCDVLNSFDLELNGLSSDKTVEMKKTYARMLGETKEGDFAWAWIREQ